MLPQSCLESFAEVCVEVAPQNLSSPFLSSPRLASPRLASPLVSPLLSSPLLSSPLLSSLPRKKLDRRTLPSKTNWLVDSSPAEKMDSMHKKQYAPGRKIGYRRRIGTIMAWRAPSNGRLPFDDGSVWLQTLGKRVSDEKRKKRKTSKTIRKKTQAKIVES